MLHKKIIVIIFTLLLATGGCAYADGYDDTTFNAGLEFSFINRPSYNNSTTGNAFKGSSSDTKLAISKNEPGVNAYVGARFTENWGGQIGFGFIAKASGNVPGGQATNKISNIFLDILGFINIATDLDMMGLLGYGMLKCNPNVTNTTLYNQSSLTKRKLGLRLGGGLQYNFANSWSSRIILVYQKGNPVFLNSLLSVSFGLVYTFPMQ
ncbi:MAG TPA: outer membrane beta-barrel protein [Gammaproteobacteria bacterium]|nr:outer membrane beta-barrel protein [Gammaproteobacteria bacterium]